MTCQSISIFLLGFFLAIPGLFGQDEAELIIRITNVDTPNGNMMIAIYDSPDTFMGPTVVKGLIIPVIQDKELKFEVKDLPKGTYAISVFHDENGNGELDSNLFRLPKEPYGFSNDARGSFGPPTYEQVKFDFQSDKQEMVITLR